MTSSVLIPAQEGRHGPFHTWLEKLGLKDFLSEHPIPQLVEWGWLQPEARYVFDREFILNWVDFPYVTDENYTGNEFILWKPEWSIDEVDSELWCIDPILHASNEINILLSHIEKHISTEAPVSLNHPRGIEVFPYCDYFYHWHGYALIDHIFRSDNGPWLRTPDLAQKIKSWEKWCSDMPPSVFRHERSMWPKEGDRAKHFTWISHYRQTFEAVDRYLQRHPAIDDHKSIYQRAAKTLAEFLSLTSIDLENALIKSLLVVAQKWLDRKDTHKGHWVKCAWLELQKDVKSCIQWLCLLEDKDLDFYLDKYQISQWGARERAQLSDVLDYGYFKDKQLFMRIAGKYIERVFPELTHTFNNNRRILSEEISHITNQCPPFISFLAAFKALHDDISFQENKHQLDLRHRRPTDHFTTLAIRTETCLKYMLFKHNPKSFKDEDSLHKILSNFHELTDPDNHKIRESLNDRDIKKLPRFDQGTENPINNIRGKKFEKRTLIEEQFIKAMLGCVASRNYFAHMYDPNPSFIRSNESEFLMASIVFTTWTLLRDYCNRITA